MYSFELKHKLARLNSQLFINEGFKRQVHGDYFSTSLCLTNGKRSEALKPHEYNYLETDAQKYLQDFDSGNLPEFLCAVPVGWIPEHDVFKFELDASKKHIANSKYVARGWRSILILLARHKRVIDIDKARKVFNCPDLGLCDYDNLTRDEKLLWAAGLRNAK